MRIETAAISSNVIGVDNSIRCVNSKNSASGTMNNANNVKIKDNLNIR